MYRTGYSNVGRYGSSFLLISFAARLRQMATLELLFGHVGRGSTHCHAKCVVIEFCRLSKINRRRVVSLQREDALSNADAVLCHVYTTQGRERLSDAQSTRQRIRVKVVAPHLACY